MELGKWTHKHFGTLALRWSGGDLTEDQERVQKEFSDDGILVRWNLRQHKTEVWYIKGGPPYCVVSYDGRTHTGRIIKDMRSRLKTPDELYKVYTDVKEGQENEFKFKRDDCYAEMGRGIRNISRDRVITSG